MGVFKLIQEDFINEQIKSELSQLRKEISAHMAGIDPNDLQLPTGPCTHVWDRATDTCQLCHKSWNNILWGDTKPCCSGGGNGPMLYENGKWHSSDCDTLKPPANIPNYKQPAQIDYRPQGSKKGLCTCGSASVGSDKHSDYCDIK